LLTKVEMASLNPLEMLTRLPTLCPLWKSTLGTDGGLVSFAVRVDFLVGMLLAMKNPGGG